MIGVGILPGVAMRGQTIGVFRINTRALLGGFVSVGPFAEYRSLAPQVNDVSYGGAIRVGQTSFIEAQFGYFERSFSQTGSENLKGRGFAGNLIYGMRFSPYLGVDLMLAGKRISSGTLDKRWILDLVPLFSIHGDF